MTVAGAQVNLTATEYQLLYVLSVNAGRVSTYDTLLRQVWHERSYATPALVRAFVKRLRRKLGDDSDKPAYICKRARGRLPHGSARRQLSKLPVGGYVCASDRPPERVGIEPTSPCIGRVDNGFEDRGDHQAPITLPNAKRRSAPVKSN